MDGWVDLGYPAMHRPGVELAISRSHVRRPNHYTTEPNAQQYCTQLMLLERNCYCSNRWGENFMWDYYTVFGCIGLIFLQWGGFIAAHYCTWLPRGVCSLLWRLLYSLNTVSHCVVRSLKLFAVGRPRTVTLNGLVNLWTISGLVYLSATILISGFMSLARDINFWSIAHRIFEHFEPYQDQGELALWSIRNLTVTYLTGLSSLCQDQLI